MNTKRVHGILSLILLPILLGGCDRGADLPALIETHRAASEARLALFPALQNASGDVPTPAGQLDLVGRPDIIPNRPGEPVNLLIFRDQDLGDLAHEPVGGALPSSPLVAHIIRALNEGTSVHSGYDDEADRLSSDFDRFERSRYVAVIRTLGQVDGIAFGDSFVGGSYRGEAVFWDLDDAQWIGGFSFSGSDDRETITVSDRASAANTLQDAVRRVASAAFFESLAAMTGGGEMTSAAPVAVPCPLGACLPRSTCTCDSAGRLLTEERDTDGDGAPNQRSTFRYDGEGRRIRTELDRDLDGSPDTVIEKHYDDQGRLAVETSAAGDGPPLNITVFAYNSAGQLTIRETQSGDRSRVTRRCVHEPPCENLARYTMCPSDCQGYSAADAEPPQLTAPVH